MAVAPKAEAGGRQIAIAHNKPLVMHSRHFAQHKFLYYRYLRDHLPVHRARIAFVNLYVTSRYEDCLALVKDDRFVRNRSRVSGGRRTPLPLPKNIALLANSMITEDDPEHRRLRGLVQKAFSPKNLSGVEQRVTALTHELLDQMPAGGEVDLQQAYALPVPVTVIGEMMGVQAADMDRLRQSVRVLSQGLSGWTVLRTLVWDMRKAVAFVRELVARKREQPADDILSALIAAEEDGDQLSEDEIVAMVFLLIVAGFETTVHLITNGVLALLQHPAQLQKLRRQPALINSAVEEILRYAGPVHGTKLNYATERVELRGVTIPKGAAVMPLLGSANRDEEFFPAADVFDIERANNKHLAFSQGKHFCLGAFLARMETRIALQTLLERAPELRLAVPEQSLQLQALPGWHRYGGLPVKLT